MMQQRNVEVVDKHEVNKLDIRILPKDYVMLYLFSENFKYRIEITMPWHSLYTLGVFEAQDEAQKEFNKIKLLLDTGECYLHIMGNSLNSINAELIKM